MIDELGVSLAPAKRAGALSLPLFHRHFMNCSDSCDEKNPDVLITAE